MNARSLLSSSLLGLATLAVLVAGAAPTDAQTYVRYNRPLRSARVDLATGVVTRGPAVTSRVAPTIADFTNIDLGGFVGFDTGGGACEWIDAATKGTGANQPGNPTDLMSEIVFAYCSVIADPASGGPGGSVQLGFYEGYQVGGPTPTTAVALLNLTGLPGNTATSSVSAWWAGGGARCYFFTLDLADLVSFADGPIGYSWRFTDVGTTGVLAGTFPFLSCVQSCSLAGPDGQGMIDYIDKYCPPGGVANTFTFGTTGHGGYFTSFSMDIREVADIEAVVTSWNGVAAVNADCLRSSTIVSPGIWDVAVEIRDAHQAAGSAPVILKVRADCFNGPRTNALPGGRSTQILVGGPLYASIAGTHGPESATPYPFAPIPVPSGLVGYPWAAQATVLGGGFVDFTTARCGVIGSMDLVGDVEGCHRASRSPRLRGVALGALVRSGE